MADDTYDPFNLRKHPGYYAELVQERDPTHDVAASYVKNHQYDGGILGRLERNPHGLGDSPLPFDPTGAEVRSTSEGGSAFAERPKDHMQPVAELISPTLGAFGAGQMAGTAYKEAGEGDYQEAGMSLAPLLAGMVVPGAPKGVRGPKAITREIDQRGFYSPSLEAVKGLGQESGTVQQFRSMLLKAGGKPKELEAVGFDRAFPDPNAKVSRQEIEQYLRDNRVNLGSVVQRDADIPDINAALETARASGDADTVRLLERVKLKVGTQQIDKQGIINEINAARQPGNYGPKNSPLNYPLPPGDDGAFLSFEAQKRAHDLFRDIPRPKFESYSTPGGIPGSYREVVTTIPPAKSKWEVVDHPTFEGQFALLDKSTGQYASNVGSEGKALNWKQREQAVKDAEHRIYNDNTYTSSHWPGITNPLLHYRQKDFLNHADPTSVGALEKVTQPFDAAAFSDKWTAKGVRNFVADRPGRGQIQLSDLVVPKDKRGQGVGSEYMTDLINAADAEGKTITLTAALDYGSTSLPRLKGFYKKFGFVENKGRNKDFAISDNMYRLPKKTPSPQSGSGEGTTPGGAFRSPESNLPSKTRVLDEMQSDWAQRARDQGTRDPAKIAELEAAWKAKDEAVSDVADEIDAFAYEHAPGALQSTSAEVVIHQLADKRGPVAEAAGALRDKWLRAKNERLDANSKWTAAKNGVPSAPYISNTSDWVDLGLKQALIDAAKDPSVNRLAWAPGKVQADRYNLKNTISGIRYSPETKSLQVTRPYDDAGKWYGFDGGDNVTPEALPGLVGKDLAEKLLAAPKQAMGRGSPYDAHTLTDLGSIEIGGHGMRSFYGDMTPEGYQSGIVGTRLQKLVRGLDPEAARVEPTEVPTGPPRSIDQIMREDLGQGGMILQSHPRFNELMEQAGAIQDAEKGRGRQIKTYPGVPITPAMREKILKEGLPLFNIAALSALVSRMLGQGPAEGEDQ
jgi:ribosomal protein S18 acetylase RimI-like enzyme